MFKVDFIKGKKSLQGNLHFAREFVNSEFVNSECVKNLLCKEYPSMCKENKKTCFFCT